MAERVGQDAQSSSFMDFVVNPPLLRGQEMVFLWRKELGSIPPPSTQPSLNCKGRAAGCLRQREASSACSLRPPERFQAVFGARAFFSLSVRPLEIFTAKQITVLGGNKVAILLVFVVAILMSQGQKILIFKQRIKNICPYCFSFWRLKRSEVQTSCINGQHCTNLFSSNKRYYLRFRKRSLSSSWTLITVVFILITVLVPITITY